MTSRFQRAPRLSHTPWFHVAALCVLGALLGLPATSAAQSGDNVLVVINTKSPESVRIGEYYMARRAIAPDHVVRINTQVTESITRATYEAEVESPIGVWLFRQALQDKILYIVLTKGVPLRVTGTEGRDGSVASVDSELTVLYRKLLGLSSPTVGRVPNPYYHALRPIGEASRFTRVNQDIYLVTRLDGFSVDDVIKLVDRSMAPATAGKIVLDEKATLVDRGGDQWLADAAAVLGTTAPERVVLEKTRALASTSGPVMGYYSWGSNDPANRLRRFGLQFANGAIGGMFVSYDGRTFAEPLPGWAPSDTTQSLTGDLIRDGITGVSGHVAEPYLDATIRPQILFPAYLAGFTLAESFYLSMPYLSWQTVIIGDPLCAPFLKSALSDGDIQKGLDPDTELPAVFSERRLKTLTQSGLNAAALKLALKLEVQLSRGNRSEMESLLVRATELEPRLTMAQLQLGGLYEERKDFAKATERYRRVVALEPRNAAALNNLAYLLASHGGSVQEALGLAERAYQIAPAPVIADTLGWVHHLLGNDRAAAPLIEQAAANLATNPDVLIHAATVHAALGDLTKARAELDAAAKLDPRLDERDDVKPLRARLRSGQ